MIEQFMSYAVVYFIILAITYPIYYIWNWMLTPWEDDNGSDIIWNEDNCSGLEYAVHSGLWKTAHGRATGTVTILDGGLGEEGRCILEKLILRWPMVMVEHC